MPVVRLQERAAGTEPVRFIPHGSPGYRTPDGRWSVMKDAHEGRVSMWCVEDTHETLPGGHVRGLAAVRALITELLRDAPHAPRRACCRGPRRGLWG